MATVPTEEKDEIADWLVEYADAIRQGYFTEIPLAMYVEFQSDKAEDAHDDRLLEEA